MSFSVSDVVSACRYDSFVQEVLLAVSVCLEAMMRKGWTQRNCCGEYVCVEVQRPPTAVCGADGEQQAVLATFIGEFV